MKKITDNKGKKRKHSENMEGFSEGIFGRIKKLVKFGGIKKLVKKATNGTKNFF